jgi:hypothetical protein
LQTYNGYVDQTQEITSLEYFTVVRSVNTVTLSNTSSSLGVNFGPHRTREAYTEDNLDS